MVEWQVLIASLSHYRIPALHGILQAAIDSITIAMQSHRKAGILHVSTAYLLAEAGCVGSGIAVVTLAKPAQTWTKDLNSPKPRNLQLQNPHGL